MCKTIKKSFDENLTYEKLMDAYYRAAKRKGNKKELLRFNMDLETNICSILKELKEEKFVTGKYRTFTVYEPKERIIKSLPFKDRIVQQWYIEEFIKPYIVPRFINSNCACIENRGTLFAVNLCQKYMRIMKRKYEKYYILKCDIKKYFYNIDKNILYEIMKKYIVDKKLLKLTHTFIFDSKEKVGIPIGNYTSQFFANIYLNELDIYVKQVLKQKYYIRYMDDMILLVPTKEECIYLKEMIYEFITKNLKLEYNSKSRYYPNSMGVNFCGYRIYETHKLLRNRSKKKIKKNIKKWNKLYLEGQLNSKKMILCWNSWRAHSKHCDSYNFRYKMYNRIKANEFIEVN